MSSLSFRILQKTFLRTNSVTHMLRDFKWSSRKQERGAGERERAGSFQMSGKQERGAGKLVWARLCRCNLLCPEWTLRNSSGQGRASHHLPHPLWAEDDQGLEGKGFLHRLPGTLSLPRTHWAGRVDKARFSPSSLLSQPPPQTYTDLENGRQTEKEFCLKSENMKREGRQHSVFLT